MYIQTGPLGRAGILPDQPQHMLPVGAWSDSRNVRFNDGYIERIAEPVLFIAYPVGYTGMWGQLYEDGSGSRVCVALDSNTEGSHLFRLSTDGTIWEDVTNLTDYPTGYTEGAKWHSFQWGENVVFNNGVDVPQILYDGASEFVNLPNWGIINGVQATVYAGVLRPFRNIMMAADMTIDGERKPNMVWWSSPGVIDNDDSEFNAPVWDYLDISKLAGFNYVGVDEAPIVEMLAMGNRMMIYTQTSTHYANAVGGRGLFTFAKAGFEYGAYGPNSVVSYGNRHLCVSPLTIYVHDGSTVAQIADARVQKSFYKSIDDFSTVYLEENVQWKEIHIVYTSNEEGRRNYAIYNYKDDTWAIAQAEVEGFDCINMSYGLEVSGGSAGQTWDDLASSTWNSLSNTTWNELGGQVGPDGGRVMYWFSLEGMWLAEQDPVTDSRKDYYVARSTIDFSELNPQLTTNLIKELNQIVPHVDGTATMDVSFGWTNTLGVAAQTTNVEPFTPGSSYKVDCRTAGRWLDFRMDLTGDGEWRLSSMDFDMEPTYGR